MCTGPPLAGRRGPGREVRPFALDPPGGGLYRFPAGPEPGWTISTRRSWSGT